MCSSDLSIVAGAGLVGLTISLAAQESASNLFSGIGILLDLSLIHISCIKNCNILSHSIPYPARAGHIKKGLTRRSSHVILLARKFVSGRGELPHWRYSPRRPARVLTLSLIHI